MRRIICVSESFFSLDIPTSPANPSFQRQYWDEGTRNEQNLLLFLQRSYNNLAFSPLEVIPDEQGKAGGKKQKVIPGKSKKKYVLASICHSHKIPPMLETRF